MLCWKLKNKLSLNHTELYFFISQRTDLFDLQTLGDSKLIVY